jgi:RimJ/RimL family protein N-acetyltransferase
MKSLMLDHAFRYVDRVLFEVGENNLRSQRALQKIGAHFVETIEFPGLDGTILRGVRFEIRR